MRNLYPRLAATNLKKNRRFYLPYLLACIVIVALFCIILTLASDPYLGQMQYGGSVSQVLGFGVFIMALFSAIILFYTNSTFTKQRKREFAIYNILGMEKRHISYVLFWESLYTAAWLRFSGLVAAGVFSKLLAARAHAAHRRGGHVRAEHPPDEHRLYGGVLRRAVFAAATQHHPHHPSVQPRAAAARPAARASASRAASGSLHCSAPVCLAAGYLISLRTNAALYAIQNFFPAVILVIIGTYLTFIALSIVVLKALRKNRRYYYKPATLPPSPVSSTA